MQGALKNLTPAKATPAKAAKVDTTEKTRKTPKIRKMMPQRHADRASGGGGMDRGDAAGAERLHPEPGLCTVPRPHGGTSAADAMGGGAGMPAALLLTGALEGAAMWDALHSQSVWEVLSAATRAAPVSVGALPPAAGGAGGGESKTPFAKGALTKRSSRPAAVGESSTARRGASPPLLELGDGGGGPGTLSRRGSSSVGGGLDAESRTESLVAMLADGDAAVRHRAVLAVGRLPVPVVAERHLGALARCLDDEASAVRVAALAVLGSLPPASLHPHTAELVAQLEHAEPAVRAAAVDALGALQASLPTLVVPESALVVSAVLGARGRARGVFCYVDEKLVGPHAPPFAFVPVAEEARRMPGALGWVAIAYEPRLVRALGAGELLPDGAARLRSVDVVRRHEHAEQLLKEFEAQRRQKAQRRLGDEAAAPLGVAHASGAAAAPWWLPRCCAPLLGCAKCVHGAGLVAGGSCWRRESWIAQGWVQLAEAVQRCLPQGPSHEVRTSFDAARRASYSFNDEQVPPSPLRRPAEEPPWVSR